MLEKCILVLMRYERQCPATAAGEIGSRRAPINNLDTFDLLPQSAKTRQPRSSDDGKEKQEEAQREQTYQGLIEAAESLFAEHGIAAVSLRQIGEYAGSFNTSVVGYYFGSKEALIEAIYRHRLPQIELWRAQFLEDMDRRGLGMNLRQLLRLIWLPWYDQRDKEGRHSYGRFLFSIDREGLGWTREVLDPDYPASFEAHSRIKRFLEANQLPNPDFRFAMQITMILKTLYYIDRNGLSEERSRPLFLDALDMAEASLMSGTDASVAKVGLTR